MTAAVDGVDAVAAAVAASSGTDSKVTFDRPGAKKLTGLLAGPCLIACTGA